MAESTPQETHQRLAEALNAGDLESLCALYEPEASIVPEPGHLPVSGTQSIRKALETFLELKPTIEVETVSAIQAGNIALLRSQWRLSGTASDGTSIEMSHSGTEVLRRQLDGRWLYVIDHPFWG